MEPRDCRHEFLRRRRSPFVTLGFQRFLHGYILKMPIALRIARVRIIMESVFDENADRLLFTVENPWDRQSSPDVGKAADAADDFAEWSGRSQAR